MVKVTRELLEQNVIQWGKERGLLIEGNEKKQVLKLMSEVGELADAIINKDKNEILDAIGDCEVVLTLLKSILEYEQDVPLALAWKEIKDRKGETVDGVFIKDEE